MNKLNRDNRTIILQSESEARARRTFSLSLSLTSKKIVSFTFTLGNDETRNTNGELIMRGLLRALARVEEDSNLGEYFNNN